MAVTCPECRKNGITGASQTAPQTGDMWVCLTCGAFFTEAESEASKPKTPPGDEPDTTIRSPAEKQIMGQYRRFLNAGPPELAEKYLDTVIDGLRADAGVIRAQKRRRR